MLRKTLWTAISFLSIFVFACVTINIYFPAEKVESVAEEIVDEIRGQRPTGKESSIMNKQGLLIRETLLAFVRPSSALAEEALTVTNPTIRSLKLRMKTRYARMKGYYQKGVLREGNNGYVSIGDTKGLGLKEKRDLKTLVAAENGDREMLYEEIAKALKIDPGQTNRIAEIFAREWQKPIR